MAFTPPAFSTLRTNTLNLDTTFSILLGRYKIGEPEENLLKLLIARTQQVLDCKSGRTTQLKVFNQLVNELRQVLKENKKEKNDRGAEFLLGALLHRYFRLIQLYDDWNYYSFYKSDPRSCKLFTAIRSALQLPAATSDDYRKKDLEILDATTITTALEAFRDNMQLKDEKQIPRFKKYPHFAVDDPNFEKNLDDIINKYKVISTPLLKQYKAIKFMQSLTEKVEAERVQIKQALVEWNQIFVKKFPDFNSVEIGTIESHITTHIHPEALREKVLDRLYTSYILSNMKDMDHESFFSAMKKCNSDKARYTVVGGYVLLLKSPEIEQLQFCINEALGIEEKPEEFTDKDMLNGLKFLRNFIKTNPETVLDCEFFGGKSKMDTQIAKNLKDLIDKTSKKTEESVPVSSLVV